MKTIVLKVNDSVMDKVLYFLKNLPKGDVQIELKDDFDYISPELEKEMDEMVKRFLNGDTSEFISLEEYEKQCIK